ncbi:MAG: hypothetical protein HQL53_06710 [Magnetococcales bacterium]|nr:hypothetical protein [Magnetococcales bacterium]
MSRYKRYPPFVDRHPPSHPGRKRVGTLCPDAEQCLEWKQCRDTYNEEHREKDSCPHFIPKPKPSAS